MKTEGVVLYLKIDRNSCVEHPKVLLSDVAKIECENTEVLKKAKHLTLYNFETDNKGQKGHTTISMSILKVIELIHGLYPGVLVVNEGEADFVIEYQRKAKKSKALAITKTVVLCGIVFFGSAFSIMAFNNDISIPKMFDQFYLQVMGREASGTNALEISYCIGLTVGIMIFFNHIGFKKITHDPTPLQVEMRKYENDIDMTFIENASRGEHNIDVD